MSTSSAKNPLDLTDIGLFSAPTFADLDNDGDLDAYIGAENGDLLFFQNIGNASNPVFSAPVANPFGIKNVAVVMGDEFSEIGQTDNNPELVDFDGDGDLDLFVGTYPYGDTIYFENVGSVSNPVFAAPKINPFGLKKVGEFGSPSFVDIDGDGDMDAFVGNYPDGNTLYFQNTGTAKSPKFANPVSNPFGLGNAGGFSSPTFADIDGDGDADAFIGTEGGDVLYFRNVGTKTNPNFAGAIANPFGLEKVGTFSSPSFADIDGDGDLDAFIGVEDGTTFFFENVVSGPNQSPQFISYEMLVLDTSSTTSISRGAGNDFIRVGHGNHGNHKINTGDGRNIVKLGSGNDEVYGGSGADVIYGGAGNDVLYGYDGQDVIYGGDGNDLISGGFGQDFLDGGAGIDTVDYRNWSGGASYNLGAGTVHFYGSFTETVLNFENIKTGAGQDHIIGSSGNNIIESGAGNDVLIGGLGNDILSGGTGADIFRFNSRTEGVDTITDFSWREGDRIEIKASSFGITSKAQLSYNSWTGALSFDASPWDGIAPHTFAILANRPSGFSANLDVVLV